MGIFNRLLGKSQVGYRGIQLEEYLSGLPRCHSSVIIAGPTYVNSRYKGQIIAPADKLQASAAEILGSVIARSEQDQVVLKAFPMWLQAAETGGSAVSRAPFLVTQFLKGHIPDIIKDGIAHAYCNECQSVVDEIKMDKLDNRTPAGWSFWTDEWRCPQGHLLYREDRDLRFIVKHQ